MAQVKGAVLMTEIPHWLRESGGAQGAGRSVMQKEPIEV
jgi:hypothetical protein